MPQKATSDDIRTTRERLRHREINETVNSFSKIIPGFARKVKKEKLRLIIFYLKYLFLNVCRVYDLPLKCCFGEYETRLFNCDTDEQKDLSSKDKRPESMNYSLRINENVQPQLICLEELKQDNIPTMRIADESVVQNPSICPQIKIKRKPNIVFLKKSYATCVDNTHVVPTNHPPASTSFHDASILCSTPIKSGSSIEESNSTQDKIASTPSAPESSSLVDGITDNELVYRSASHLNFTVPQRPLTGLELLTHVASSILCPVAESETAAKTSCDCVATPKCKSPASSIEKTVEKKPLRKRRRKRSTAKRAYKKIKFSEENEALKRIAASTHTMLGTGNPCIKTKRSLRSGLLPNSSSQRTLPYSSNPGNTRRTRSRCNEHANDTMTEEETCKDMSPLQSKIMKRKHSPEIISKKKNTPLLPCSKKKMNSGGNNAYVIEKRTPMKDVTNERFQQGVSNVVQQHQLGTDTIDMSLKFGICFSNAKLPLSNEKKEIFLPDIEFNLKNLHSNNKYEKIRFDDNFKENLKLMVPVDKQERTNEVASDTLTKERACKHKSTAQLQMRHEEESSIGVLTKKENVSPCGSPTQRKTIDPASQIKKKPLKDCTNEEANGEIRWQRTFNIMLQQQLYVINGNVTLASEIRFEEVKPCSDAVETVSQSKDERKENILPETGLDLNVLNQEIKITSFENDVKETSQSVL